MKLGTAESVSSRARLGSIADKRNYFGPRGVVAFERNDPNSSAQGATAPAGDQSGGSSLYIRPVSMPRARLRAHWIAKITIPAAMISRVNVTPVRLR